VHTYDRRYNWADVTQEIYGVARCNELLTGPFVVAGLAMADDVGAAVDIGISPIVTSEEQLLNLIGNLV
jgi:hypothetical protein